MTSTAVAELALALAERDLTIAVAESLTCGLLASTIGAGVGASDWFRGGVIAYMDEVKFSVLGVSPGPVVSASCAQQLALGVRQLLAADLAIAVTGVGGPGEEGQPAGTVYIGIADSQGPRAFHERFDGDPEQVLALTVERAIELAIETLEGLKHVPGS